MGAGAACFQNLNLTKGQIGFYGTQESVTREQLEYILSEDSGEIRQAIPEIVLFGQEEGITAENKSVGRSTSVIRIEAAGVMHLIMPGSLMAGSFVTDSDDSGCVISRKAAEELFGTWECVGESLVMEGKDYIVRGVLNEKEKLCMVQGEEGKGYPYIRLYAPGLPVSYVRQLLAGFLPDLAAEQGESGETPWISEGDLYLGLGRLAAGLPLWTAWILILTGIRRRSESLRGIRREIARIVLFTAGFAGICGILLLTVRFSDDYVPTAWSDFEFWTELFAAKTGEIHRLFEESLLPVDQGMFLNLAGLAGVSVLGAWVLILCFSTKAHPGFSHNSI